MPGRLTAWGMICTLPHMSHTDFIKMWPTLSDFASDLGVQYGTAKAMRRRNSIPPLYWPVMVERARARRLKGVTERALAMAVAKASAAA